MSDPLFLRACRREPVERTPIWMMRQAGRYQPSYRAVRAKHTFLEVCQTPELACQVTLAPIDESGFDASIVFSDILITLPAMGIEVSFPDKGPKLARTVRDRAAVDALRIPEPERDLGYVLEAIRLIRAGLDARGGVPLIGFAGAPFTMLTYVVEGGGSKDYPHTRALLFGDPTAAHALLEKLADTCATFLEAQVAAGAQAVQLFDSWAGILAPPQFREFALRWATRAIERLRASPLLRGVPIIYFANGCAPYLDVYADCGADVLGVDWRVDIAQVRAAIGDRAALQGNLDPGALLGTPAAIRARVGEILAAAGPVGHVFNLGHGVLPETDPANVRAMIDAVRELSCAPR